MISEMKSTRNSSFKRWHALAMLFIGVLAVSSFSCTQGAIPRGWSGGVVGNNSIYLGRMTGSVTALEVGRPTVIWDFALKARPNTSAFGCASAPGTVAIYGTPALDGELVLVTGYNGKAYGINASRGVERWVYPRDDYLAPIVGAPAVDSGTLYFGATDLKSNSSLYSLDAQTGYENWKHPTGGKIWAKPIINDGTVYVGSFDKSMYAIQTDNTTKWKFETGGAIIATPAVSNGALYFGSLDRYVYAVNTDGTLKWKSSVMAERWFWANPIIFNNNIFSPALDGKVYILDAATGTEKTEPIDLASPISSSPVLIGNSLYFATEAGKVYAVDGNSFASKELADVRALANESLTVYASLFANENTLYVHAQTKTRGSLIYALDLQTGAPQWRYPAAASK